MASIDDTLSAIGAASQQLEEGVSAVGAAGSEAEETQGLLGSIGAEGPAGQLGLCKDALDQAQSFLRSALDCLEEASGAAEAARG